MDLRWVAYTGSGLLAAASLLPVAVHQDEAQPTPAERPAPGRSAPEVRSLLEDVERHTARLRDHAASAPTPRAPSRDPFRFGAPSPRQEILASASDRIAKSTADIPTPPPVPEPTLTLVGMAERAEGERIRRLAVLAGFGDVHLVGAGDRVADRFLVRAVGAEWVELEDEREGQQIRLSLDRRP
jgi:hypothetical protein